MGSLELDIENASSLESVSQTLMERYPDLNVVFNNAGIMQFDDAAGTIDENSLTSTITTNLLGPIRLTSVLIEHLKKQKVAERSSDSLQHFMVGLHSIRSYRSVLLDKSSAALLCVVSTLQAARDLRASNRDCSALDSD